MVKTDKPEQKMRTFRKNGKKVSSRKNLNMVK